MRNIFKYFLLSFLFSSWSGFVWAQTAPLHSYTLTTNETGATKNYVARDYISLNPGFAYNAIGGNSFSARIDPFTINATPFSNQINSTPDIFGNSYVVGAIDGSASVSPSGAAAYEIPIKVAPGTGGMTPQLSIEYSSQGSDGLLGVGFSISGLSAISRSPNSIKDGVISPVNLDGNDKFSLDGNRLISVSGSYGANNTEYRTENNSFSKIISYTTTSTRPESFVVYTKSGLIYEYGKTTDSKFKGQNSEHVIYWLLNRVSDTKGNYYTISYIQDRANGAYKPDRIDYTGNATSSPVLTTYCSIRFIYDSRTVTNTTYIKGNKSCVSSLLSKIQVYYQENVVKSYILNYNTPNYGKYLLAKVTESSANGDKVAPVTFDWFLNNNYKPYEWANDQSYYPQQFVKYNNEIYLGDFNGDGKTDFVATPISGTYANKWGLFLANELGSQCTYVNSEAVMDGFKKIITGDFNGDGKTDIIQCRQVSGNSNINYFVYYSTGSGFTYGGPAFFTDTRTSELIVGDFNGDGISDVVAYYPGAKDYRTFTSSYSNGVVTPLVEKSVRNISTNWDRVETGDFNGDGLTDIINLNDSGNEMLKSDGYGTVSITTTSTWPKKGHIINFGDFNGDGKTDMLVTGFNDTTWGDWIMDFSTGIGFDEIRITKRFESYTKQIFVGDLNGDGKDDFYAVDKTGTGSLVKMQLYIADGSTSCFSYQDGNYVYPLDTWKFYSGDFNGDGRIDYLDRAKNSNGFTGYQLQNSITDRDKLMKSATDSYGNTTSFTYKPLTNKAIYTPSTDGVYPVSDFTGAMPVVDKMTQPDGAGGTQSTSYKYAGAKLHKQGNGFLGFSKFTSTDDQTGLSSISIYDFDPTKYVMGLKRTETRITKDSYNNQLLSEVDYENTYKQYGTYSPIYTYLPTSTTEKKYELGSATFYSTTTSSYTYDDYGNVLTTSQSFGPEAIISSVNVYTNNTSNWFLGRLTSATVTKHVTDQNDIVRKSTFEYNPTSGLLVKETVEPDNALLGFYKTYEHDDFGNILKSTTFANGKSRSQRSVYDDKGRFEVENYDAMGNKVTKVIDPIYCTVTSATDPNLLTATTVYDLFGREKSSKGPDGSMSVVAYRWSNGDENTPPNAVWFKYAEVSGKPGATAYYDKFGRVIRKAVVGFDGQMIFVDTEYNALGQVARESDPYFKGESSQWTGFAYDLLGRLKQKTLPDLSTIKITYNGLTTITENPLSQTDTKQINQQGHLVASTNYDGKSITYVYNSAGNMTEMHDSKNNALKMEYDILGNRTKLDDPELGIITSGYNAFGELTSETDAKNNLFTMEYDDLGRMKKRVEAEGSNDWIYDTGTCGIGRLASVTGPGGYAQATEYDKFGRVVKVIETIAGTTYTTSTDYDSYSRVIRTYYPTVNDDGPVVRNEYNTNGYLSKVLENQTGKVYWTAGAINARGQMTQSLYGNGMQTTNTYDLISGSLKHIKTEKGTTKVQDWEYGFDALGNLTTRTDVKRSMSETFEYDNLNRLKFVRKDNVQTLAMTYDELGNILTKTDVGQYGYDKPGCPHSVTGINPYAGSILKTITQNISYTSFDKVRTISQGTDSLTLSYGSSYQRIYGDSYQNKALKKRRVYVNSLYEQEKDFTTGNIRETFYIFGGDGLVAIRVKDNLGDKVSYVHKDHLGSIQCLTDDAGALAQEMSYDAWGNRRNADTWQVYTTPQSGLITDRGFTGHEHMDLFDLVNMNGRVFDPVIGRFLSADPLIQNPENLQSLNRYSYCLNNPLSMTDPSGYTWLSNNWRSLAGAAIGITATIITAGLLAPAGLATLTAWGATAAGAVGGFAGGFSGTLLNGGDIGQAFKAGVVGGVVGGASGFLAFAAGSITGNSINAILERMGRHAFVNAWMSGIQGQNMLSGALTGAASSLGGAGLTSLKIENVGLLTVGNAVIGGTVSVIGGGKFANGAVTGAFTMLFNELAHKYDIKQQNKLLTQKIGQAALAERNRCLKNQSQMALQYPEMEPEIQYDITVLGTSGWISNAPIVLGDKTVTADIMYAPSKNNMVRTIAWPRNQPTKAMGTDLVGYLFYFHNSTSHNVVTMIFTDQYNYNTFKNYILGH
ncbi:MAG: FG-GAP-like repeat-containing protein [Bacteroidota bacterium]|nr:FG-GAP-like repeat-containing protein [Bacteroidota bacterium]